MFTADLSWSDPHTEKIGERRERKARERSTTAGSVKTSLSSRSSISVDRELWWTSGLKKAKSIKPNLLRPMTSRSSSQKTVHANPKKPDLKLTNDFKDPTLQPGWTYSSTLSQTLPSGASLDLPEYEVPELEGDTSSRRTDSTGPRLSHDRRWEIKTPVTDDSVKETFQRQQTSPVSFVTSRTRRSSTATERDDYGTEASLVVPMSKKKPQLARIEGGLSREALKLHDAIQRGRTAEEADHTSCDSINSDSRFSCKPLSQWECLTPRGVPQEMQLQPKSIITKVAVAPRSTTIELTRFQRFIRRMESAGPKIVLERLKEEWQDPVSDDVDEELALEKQLWMLTGFQMQNLGSVQIVPKPECDTGRLLELHGNLSEVYQLSAMHPSQTVHFLTTKPQRLIPLPGNVSFSTVRDVAAVPLPYPEDYFSHIRASTLPSLVPSAKLPDLFHECYKLLAPGGLLEIRIMDAAPVRKTAGPLMRMWIEDRLSVNLERLFRCSKPCLLVPAWLADAGFELVPTQDDQNITLRCAFDESFVDVDNELSTIIGRALWKDIWGSFVDNVPGESKWWWEDDDIIKECLERQTGFECRTIFAYKR
ncbi:Nn.00g017460.m01.CDS01 [Neocucurbitaria sp. VM-36]